MDDTLLIAQQARKIAELEAAVEAFTQARDEVRMIIYCIGGPLNDNKLGYTSQQMKDFYRIIQSLDVA